MSYLKQTLINIIPKECYKIIKSCNCSKEKQLYFNTEKFRVNANGNNLDIWLIYQCENCKHTLNLPLYPRINKNKIDKALLEKFYENDKNLAFDFGLNKNIFKENNLTISGIEYNVEMQNADYNNTQLKIINPYKLQIKPEKIISEYLGISTNSVKKMIESKKIEQIQMDINKTDTLIYTIK